MRLDSFDLNLLVALDALLRRRSVTEAANELHLTQSAMSSALKRARQHFEDDLIYYDGQSMVPTAVGSMIESQIPDILAQLRNIASLRANRDLFGLKRRFTFIASDYVCAVFMSAFAKHISQVAPLVSVVLLPFTQETYSQFQRGAVDFMIAPDFGLTGSVDFTPLFEDTFSVAMWAGHPKAKSGLLAEDYVRAPHVVTQFFREGGMSHLERFFDKRDDKLNVVAALSSFVTLPFYVEGTANLATIHNRLLNQFKPLGDLVFQPPPILIPPLQEYLITARKHRHDAEAQLLAHEILRVGKTLEPNESEL